MPLPVFQLIVWVAVLALGWGGVPAPARAQERPLLLINGQEFADARLTPAGRILVPMRPLFEAAGARVFWDPTAQAVRAFTAGHTVTLVAGSKRAWRDDEEVTLDQEPLLIEGRLYVPVRFAAEALGGSVEWDGERQVADARLPLPPEAHPAASAPPPPVIPYTEEDLELLARVINAEAYDEPYLGKVAVGAVIVNRVKNRFLGTTIREVIMRPGQFAVIANGRAFSLPLQEDARRAALEALHGRDPTGGALYFNNMRTVRTARQRAFWDSLTRTVVIGNHTFFKE